MSHSVSKIALLTFIALCAFSANSIICRLALGGQSIDATSFTFIRLFSGAVILLFLVLMTNKGKKLTSKGTWAGGITLFIYAAAFSFAYITLDTATGALILFGAVQLSMLLISYVRGSRFYLAEWLGIVVSFAGFSYLVWPLVALPSFTGALLMSVSGISWGVYTLIGRSSKQPLVDTCFNFVRSLPFVFILLVFTYQQLDWSNTGIILAIVSGAVTSGIGYAVWYFVLPSLAPTQAAVLQLTVPIIAALGGVVFVSEPITLRLIAASLFVLGGIALVIFAKQRGSQ